MEATILAMLLLVLAAICSNISSLQLARSAVRKHEMRIRIAVGADTRRLRRQLLIENMILALGGGIGAVLFGRVVGALLRTWLGRATDLVETDWRVVLLVIVLVAVVTGTINLAQPIPFSTLTKHAERRRRMWLGIHAAAGCFFLVVGLIFSQSVHHRLQPQFRYPSQDIIEVSLAPPSHAFRDQTVEAIRERLEQCVRRLRELPQVESATISGLPLGRSHGIRYLGGPDEAVWVNDVDPSYFAFMGSSLLAGRLFRPDESDAVVVSKSMARRLWPNESPLGKTVTLFRRPSPTTESSRYTVVGVAQDTRESSLLPVDPLLGEVFTALQPGKISLSVILVRTANKASATLQAIRKAASFPGTDPEVIQLSSILLEAYRSSILQAILFDFIGAVLLVISVLGLCGVLWLSVVQRARDLALRVALGASRMDVIRVIGKEYFVPLGTGVAIAFLLAGQFALLTGRYLVGVRPLDLQAYIAALIVFLMPCLSAIAYAGYRAWYLPPLVELKRE